MSWLPAGAPRTGAPPGPSPRPALRSRRPMSKAFTKEEEDAGVTMPAVRARALRSPVTALGSRAARERLKDVLARLGLASDAAERARLELERDRLTLLANCGVARDDASGRVGFGAEVRLRDDTGRERVVVIASAGEVGLVAGATSVTSPIARALLGAAKGDRVEVEGPRGAEELLVLDVRFPG